MNEPEKYLSGKEILLICPKFFNYQTFIVNELKSRGASVQYVPEIEERLIFKFLRRIRKSKLQELYDKYYLESIPWQKKFDIVFVVKGAGLSLDLLKRLRLYSQKGHLLHYRWDSVRNFDNLYMREFFDHTFSFDKPDCENYGFIYHPLFFVPVYNNENVLNNHSYAYDIMFIGTANEERIRFFEKLRPFLTNNNLVSYINLYTSKWRYVKFKIKSLDTTYLTTKTLEDEEVIKIMRKSKSILDVPSKNQNGLTMRSFETLGSGKMLITTNTRIRNEHFYNPEQIKIIDSDNFNIINDFAHLSCFTFAPMTEFSLEKWIRRILTYNG
ncbi:MAG: hypothetical protein MUF36_00055 [Bacteroidales bacterium]|jgi:hypothetical protein|nr:hypothetical protein [Bacteroidales bacterium]